MQSSKCTTDTTLDQLSTIAADLDVPYPHWLGGQDADQGPSYCWECATKAVSDGRCAFVDGGWPQDSDGCCLCEDCGKLLDYTLTDYGLGEELSHFRTTRLRGRLGPHTAYQLSRVLEHHGEHPEVKSLLPKVRRALARTQLAKGH